SHDASQIPAIPIQRPHNRSAKGRAARHETTDARERRAVSKVIGRADKIDDPAAGSCKVAAAARAPTYVQRAALDAGCAGIVEHDTAIECSDACVARLEERPEVVKECRRAAIVSSLKHVVTLRVPQTVVVNLRVAAEYAIESSIGPVDRPIVGQNQAVKAIATPGHNVQDAIRGEGRRAGQTPAIPIQRPHNRSAKGRAARHVTANAGERRAVGKDVAGKVDDPATGGCHIAAAARAPTGNVQRAALDVDRTGIVEHDIAIEYGGAYIARLAKRPEVVKECRRAAIVGSLKGVVTLRVPQTVVVNLRVLAEYAIESGIGPVDRPIVGQNQAVKAIAAPGHNVKDAVAGKSHDP